MKPTARIREQAALICQVAASTPCWSFGEVALSLGLPVYGAAAKLAYLAWGRVNHATSDNMRPPESHRDAEAESLLRDGWSPGDR